MGTYKKIHVPAKCKFCGKDFVITNPYNPQKFCGRACGTRYRHLQQGNTREGAVRRIMEFIRSKGRFCMQKEILAEIHMAEHTMRYWGIDTAALNEQLGYYESERVKKHKMLTQMLASGKYHRVSDAAAELGLRITDLNHSRTAGGGFRTLIQQSGTQYSQSKLYPTKESIENAIIAELKREGAQLPAAELVRRLHFDYQRAVRYGITMEEMHHRAGIRYSRITSYFEQRFYKKASAMFTTVWQQYKFADCRSPITGRRLNYDFYIEDVKTLVEIDGEQHTDRWHHLHSAKLVAHDKRKNEYAEEHGIRLVRIPTTPRATFEDRVDHILNELKSGSCKTH